MDIPKKPIVIERLPHLKPLKYESTVQPTMHAYLRQKTKINVDEIESKFASLVNNENQLNFLETAVKCGYIDLCNFSKTYTKRFGYTPSETI